MITRNATTCVAGINCSLSLRKGNRFFEGIASLFVVYIVLLLTACTKNEKTNSTVSPPQFKVNPNPSWKADGRCLLKGAPGTFDDLAVKDPSIVRFGEKYHLFYTARSSNTAGWQMGYTSASQISQLNTATRTYLSALNGGSYFCAPQVFQFAAKGAWFLIFQSGLGASFSTNPDVSNPGGWSVAKSMGFSDGIDFWCISDGSYVYCFYSAQDGSFTIKRRRTTVASFPYNWEAPQVVATNTFEAPHVYKNIEDGNYYMIVEDLARHQELWSASHLSGTWSKIAEKWSSKDNLGFLGNSWTDQVSHVEILRQGTNEKMEIENINRCDILIQGVVNGNYSGYENIPYELGLIHNY